MSSNSSMAVNIPADIAATTAPQLIGTLINWLFFGVLSVQTYVYYLNFPDDKIGNKIAGRSYSERFAKPPVTAMTGADMYFWFATGFGNMGHIGNVNITPADIPLLCGIIAGVVQFFFAYRIYTLRRSYLWISVLIVLTSLVQTAGALAVTIRSFKLQEFSRFHENLYFPQSFDVWLIGDTVCDILIAGTMLWIFYVTRKEGNHYSNRILGRLVRLIVETNTLTASMALISFICYVTLPNSPLFVCTTVIMGKLYSNTLLVTFNNRIGLRKGFAKNGYSYEDSAGFRGPFRIGTDSGSNITNTFDINIDTVVEVKV
ncbi:hypothetical protein D9619_008575 [Psilocybe cf. subviscida]|uniref:DUF6534 domain-containing protein n=1 Tax=Psilocybe cf. subviscida TaxID=2480587 RepID=A0A8H5BB14_9AGAR|nr:hypothetical protein D9619_008575 [Psilocybe cf. subviscida]